MNQHLTSVVREIRTLRSVGAGGGRLPPATQWAISDGRPYCDKLACRAVTERWPTSRELSPTCWFLDSVLVGSRHARRESESKIYFNSANSVFACFRMGISGSASFHSVRKSW